MCYFIAILIALRVYIKMILFSYCGCPRLVIYASFTIGRVTLRMFNLEAHPRSQEFKWRPEKVWLKRGVVLLLYRLYLFDENELLNLTDYLFWWGNPHRHPLTRGRGRMETVSHSKPNCQVTSAVFYDVATTWWTHATSSSLVDTQHIR